MPQKLASVHQGHALGSIPLAPKSRGPFSCAVRMVGDVSGAWYNECPKCS